MLHKINLDGHQVLGSMLFWVKMDKALICMYLCRSSAPGPEKMWWWVISRLMFAYMPSTCCILMTNHLFRKNWKFVERYKVFITGHLVHVFVAVFLLFGNKICQRLGFLKWELLIVLLSHKTKTNILCWNVSEIRGKVGLQSPFSVYFFHTCWHLSSVYIVKLSILLNCSINSKYFLYCFWWCNTWSSPTSLFLSNNDF